MLNSMQRTLSSNTLFITRIIAAFKHDDFPLFHCSTAVRALGAREAAEWNLRQSELKLPVKWKKHEAALLHPVRKQQIKVFVQNTMSLETGEAEGFYGNVVLKQLNEIKMISSCHISQDHESMSTTNDINFVRKPHVTSPSAEGTSIHLP